MNLLLLLDMAASAGSDAPAVQAGDDRLTAAQLLAAAWGGAAQVGEAGATDALVYVGTNGLAFPIGLFAAAAAEVPFVPLNYRLSDDQLHDLLVPLGKSLVVAEGDVARRLADRGHQVVDAAGFVDRARRAADDGTEIGEVPFDADGPAVLLHTSGTTSAPKAAVLRHRHLAAYVIGTVEFAGADPGEAVLVSVPPYHVAGLANLLSNLYLGRRIVYLTQFDAPTWVSTARREAITHAMVVPTMLARIVEVLEGEGEPAGAGALPSLRALSYGGARTPVPVLQRVMARLPDVDLTNAYGLTETSSTIAVLGPADHRAARDGDEVAIARLSSAGQVLPTVEVQIRPDGDPGGDVREADASDSGGQENQAGEIWVRGEQVSGEYAGQPLQLDADGWFPTRDRGWIDADGYLFIEGRSDDTIIRGGENIAPAEIEEVLLSHPEIDQVAVVGVPDDEWGQRIAAVIVAKEGSTLDAEGVRAFARGALRGSKTPDVVEFAAELPYTETGKLLRRVVLAGLVGGG